MGIIDKLRNKTQMGKGHAKQEVGKRTDDPYLEGKGQAERIKGGAKQVGEQAKDAARDVRRSVD